MASLHVSFNAPLCECDSEEQTYGCRQNNPDMCGLNGIEGICAFSSEMGFVNALQKHGKSNITNYKVKNSVGRSNLYTFSA